MKVDTDYYEGASFNAGLVAGQQVARLHEAAAATTCTPSSSIRIEQKKAFQVTDGMSDARYPVFDRNGKYLYFTASTDVGLSAVGFGHVQRRTIRSRAASTWSCWTRTCRRRSRRRATRRRPAGRKEADTDKRGDQTGQAARTRRRRDKPVA